MGGFLSKIKKETKSERSFQQKTRKSHRRKSFTLDWTRRKRSKANRASTCSENTENRAKWHTDVNADQTSSSRSFDNNWRHTTTVVEQYENKNSSTSNYFQDARIPTNQDTTASQNVRINLSNEDTIKPKPTNRSNLVIVHEILQIEAKLNRKANKARSNKKSRIGPTAQDMKKNSISLLNNNGKKSSETQQHSQILSTNKQKSLLTNNTNSLVQDSGISKIILNSLEKEAVNIVGLKEVASVKLNEPKKNTPVESNTKIIQVNTQAAIKSMEEITTANNQKAISDDQGKKTVQHEYLQEMNSENRDKTISHDLVNIVGSNELARVELEDKPNKNILNESKTKVISVNNQEVIESRDDIKTAKNQNSTSDGQGKKTLQLENLQEVKQNYENREKTISLSDIFMDKLEVEKINLTGQDFTNFKIKAKGRSNTKENSVTTTIVDATPTFATVVSTTQQNNEMNDDENIFKELTILFQENENNENVLISDKVAKSVENDESKLVHESTNYEPCDPVFLPIVYDNVKPQTTEVNVPIKIPIEAVDETRISCKIRQPKHLITNPENKQVGTMVLYKKEESNPSEKPEFEISSVKWLQDDQTVLLSDEHVDALPISSKSLEVENPEKNTIFFCYLAHSKNRKAFIMQDSEETGICVNKAEQENYYTKVKEEFLGLTSDDKSPHNDCANEITSNNLFMQKSIYEANNEPDDDKVSKPRKDETENVFEDFFILEELLLKEDLEDNLKTLSLPGSISITENKTANPSPSAKEELELIEQKITDSTVAKKIEEIKCKAEPFLEEIEAFFESEDSNKYFYIEESLQRLVAKLDDMYDEIGDDEWLRQRRKFVYKFIFSLFDALDEKVKINAQNVQL